jgi:hypothetical protein
MKAPSFVTAAFGSPAVSPLVQSLSPPHFETLSTHPEMRPPACPPPPSPTSGSRTTWCIKYSHDLVGKKPGRKLTADRGRLSRSHACNVLLIEALGSFGAVLDTEALSENSQRVWGSAWNPSRTSMLFWAHSKDAGFPIRNTEVSAVLREMRRLRVSFMKVPLQGTDLDA